MSLVCQDKYEEQRRRLDKLEHELASMKKEKALLEAHAEVLEKALMKSAMENAEVQVRMCHSARWYSLRGACNARWGFVFTAQYLSV